MAKDRPLWKIMIVACLVAVTLSLHYTVFPWPHWVHLIHRRMCYVPIIIGGLWFGLRGGLLVSGIISLATLPLALHYAGPFWGNQDLVEIIFYIGLGLLTGFLVDKGAAEHAHSESLRRQLDEHERLASLGRLASGVAHEVRTPLGSIQGAAEILSEDFPLEHPKRPFFDILLQEIERLKVVVREFLDLGRPIAVEPVQLDVREVVDDCFQSLSALAQKREVALVVHVLGDCLIWGDTFRVHQALTNLVRNAVQVSQPGMKVTLSAGRADGGCLVAVHDEGPGLPEGVESRLFEPFFTTRKDGSGLGLALVKQIVEAHGGWVQGESKPGGGACFSMWLPCQEAMERQRSPDLPTGSDTR